MLPKIRVSLLLHLIFRSTPSQPIKVGLSVHLSVHLSVCPQKVFSILMKFGR